MQTRYTKKLAKTTASLFLGSALALAHGLGAQGGMQGQQQGQPGNAEGQQQIEQQFAEAQAELQQISELLAPVQQEAQAKPEVQESLLEYDAALVENMKSLSPDHADVIDQRGQLFQNLVSAGDPTGFGEAEQAAFEQDIQQFQEVRQQLGDLEMQAQQGPEVQEKLNEYQEVFMAAIMDIEPRAEELIQRQAQLQQTLMQIRQQVTQ